MLGHVVGWHHALTLLINESFSSFNSDVGLNSWRLQHPYTVSIIIIVSRVHTMVSVTCCSTLLYCCFLTVSSLSSARTDFKRSAMQTIKPPRKQKHRVARAATIWFLVCLIFFLFGLNRKSRFRSCFFSWKNYTHEHYGMFLALRDGTYISIT